MKTKKKKAQEFECLSNADVDRILMATLYIGELNSGVGGRDLTYVSSQTILLVYLYVWQPRTVFISLEGTRRSYMRLHGGSEYS